MKVARNFLLIIFILSGLNNVYAGENSPVGYWKTVDDGSGRVHSIVHITEDSSHVLSGTIDKIFPEAGESEQDICKVCKGNRHNQRIEGMTILTGLKQDNAEWKNGEILDPKNGKVYRCTIHLIDNGSKLVVHGYIGVPLFGRSQTWVRQP
jgi:uncharacterized protein (DUF2147 family)